MNAPFSASRGTSLRDPFSAFVCDDATADVLRPIAVEHGWSPKRSTKAAFATRSRRSPSPRARASFSSTSSESGDPLSDINALAEVCEPGTVVIAAGR